MQTNDLDILIDTIINSCKVRREDVSEVFYQIDRLGYRIERRKTIADVQLPSFLKPVRSLLRK